MKTMLAICMMVLGLGVQCAHAGDERSAADASSNNVSEEFGVQTFDSGASGPLADPAAPPPGGYSQFTGSSELKEQVNAQEASGAEQPAASQAESDAQPNGTQHKWLRAPSQTGKLWEEVDRPKEPLSLKKEDRPAKSP